VWVELAESSWPVESLCDGCQQYLPCVDVVASVDCDLGSGECVPVSSGICVATLLAASVIRCTLLRRTSAWLNSIIASAYPRSTAVVASAKVLAPIGLRPPSIDKPDNEIAAGLRRRNSEGPLTRQRRHLDQSPGPDIDVLGSHLAHPHVPPHIRSRTQRSRHPTHNQGSHKGCCNDPDETHLGPHPFFGALSRRLSTPRGRACPATDGTPSPQPAIAGPVIPDAGSAARRGLRGSLVPDR
jgi:hypothetical protein